MNPLLAQIRGQLPNETVPFGLLVRGKVIEGKRAEYIEAAQLLRGRNPRGNRGNIFYRFFWNAQDPLKYVLLEAWQDSAALVAHFEAPHFIRMGEGRSIVRVRKSSRVSRFYWISDRAKFDGNSASSSRRLSNGGSVRR